MTCNPYVLFGTGPLGRAAVPRLRKAGIEPLCFADNNPKLWGTVVDGVPVCCPAEVVKQHKTAVFANCVFTSQPVFEQLEFFGVEAISFVELAHRHAKEFLPFFWMDDGRAAKANPFAVAAGHCVWADAASREEYRSQLRYRETRDRSVLSDHHPNTDLYFADDLFLLKDEVVVDCGAYDGDSIRQYLSRSMAPKRIHAFEPDRENFDKLKAYVETLSFAQRISISQTAVSDRDDWIEFDQTGDMRSALGSGSTRVLAQKLDTVLTEATYVKMDIEGAESAALRGAEKTIRRCRPILAVCLYHRPEDLWEVPLLVRELTVDYDLHLRRFLDESWECILLAVPKERKLHG